MKYKLKFEFTFPDMDKADEREAKLNLISSDVPTELESEYPIPVPNEKSIISLGGIDYKVIDIRYKLEIDCYITICYLLDLTIKKVYYDSDYFKDLPKKLTPLKGAKAKLFKNNI